MNAAQLIGAASALGGVLAALVAYLGYRSAVRRQREQAEADRQLRDVQHSQLVATTTGAIAQAANDAVGAMQTALGQADERLRVMHRQLQTMQAELVEARRTLGLRDSRIHDLEREIAELQRRIRRLEADVGGRRVTDPPGPALGRAR